MKTEQITTAMIMKLIDYHKNGSLFMIINTYTQETFTQDTTIQLCIEFTIKRFIWSSTNCKKCSRVFQVNKLTFCDNINLVIIHL